MESIVSEKSAAESTPINTCGVQEHLRLAAETKVMRCPECQKLIFRRPAFQTWCRQK
jgi:hypothetical protein